MYVMNFVSHRGIAFILNGRSLIQQGCFFDINLCVALETPLLKKCFSDLITSQSLVVQLKLVD